MITFWVALFLQVAQGAALPVPSAQEQATAEKELHRIWKADYALLPAAREAVAKKFLARGQEVVEVPFKYVILREARELAVQAGDVSTALAATSAMASAFVTDSVSEKSTVLARIESQARSPEDVRTAIGLMLDLADEAITLARLETAASVLSSVAGRANRDETQAERCRDLARRLTRALDIRTMISVVRATGLKDWASPWMYVHPSDVTRGTLNQRENVWTSSPSAPDKPFTWIRTVQLTKGAHLLYFDVSAQGEASRGAAGSGSWMLRVSANGEELAKRLISGTRWQAVEIDLGAFSNRTVTLELANAPGNGTVSNRAYWSNLYILPPPLCDVAPSENDFRRLPFPDSEHQARAERLIQTLPSPSKGASSLPEKLEWAQKLIEEAQRTTGDSPYQYVLLKKARDLGAQSGDPKTIFQAIDVLSSSFALDPFEEKLGLLSRLESSKKTPEGVDWYLRIAREAISAGRGEAALHALSRAERSARTLKYAPGSSEAKELSPRALEALSLGWASQWYWQDTAPGGIVQDTFNKRPNAWQTQPAAGDRPFRWKRRAKLPAAQGSYLQLDVSSRQPDDHHGWEWNLEVLINGKESLNKVIRGVEWRHFSVDLTSYAGREIDLELWNKSDDGHGHGQLGYWDRVCLSYEP